MMEGRSVRVEDLNTGDAPRDPALERPARLELLAFSQQSESTRTLLRHLQK